MSTTGLGAVVRGGSKAQTLRGGLSALRHGKTRWNKSRQMTVESPTGELKSFKTWYVIFEFKNHTRFITQGEVYSTEKYLFVPAMRSVAFVISRKGADKNAKAVMRGALRETGKLILSLSFEDVCTMLSMKDAGNDPNALLFERLDEMLMKLERSAAPY